MRLLGAPRKLGLGPEDIVRDLVHQLGHDEPLPPQHTTHAAYLRILASFIVSAARRRNRPVLLLVDGFARRIAPSPASRWSPGSSSLSTTLCHSRRSASAHSASIPGHGPRGSWSSYCGLRRTCRAGMSCASSASMPSNRQGYGGRRRRSCSMPTGHLPRGPRRSTGSTPTCSDTSAPWFRPRLPHDPLLRRARQPPSPARARHPQARRTVSDPDAIAESSTAPALPLRLLLLDRSCCSPDRAPLRALCHARRSPRPGPCQNPPTADSRSSPGLSVLILAPKFLLQNA